MTATRTPAEVDQILRLALLADAVHGRLMELRRQATSIEMCMVLDDLRDYTTRCSAQAQQVKATLADEVLATVEGVPS